MIIRCTHCGSQNNLPDVFPEGKQPVCGNCKSPLAIRADAKPIDITDSTFENEVAASPVPVLVDCWAPWCGPCKMVAPVLEELAIQLAGKVKICKLNVDQNQEIAAKFGIQSIPTLLLFKNGNLVNNLIGAVPKSEILKFLGF
jgi:thioredoxin 2